MVLLEQEVPLQDLLVVLEEAGAEQWPALIWMDQEH
jgi:hypothetical protein